MSEHKRADLLEDFLQRHTKTGAEATRPGGMFERPTFAFTIPADHAPSFGEDFEITLRELSYADEAAAAESGKQLSIGFEMAKRSLYAINGVALSSVQRETVWAGLGSKGRQLVTAVYAAKFTADGDYLAAALGKA